MLLKIGAQIQAADNFIDNFFRRRSDVYADRVGWLFQVGELAGQDLLVSEMAFALAQALRD